METEFRNLFVKVNRTEPSFPWPSFQLNIWACMYNMRFLHKNQTQPSLMFEGKARVYPGEALFSYSTLGQAPSLTHKDWTILKKACQVETLQLIENIVNYGCKKFFNNWPCDQCYKSFSVYYSNQ